MNLKQLHFIFKSHTILLLTASIIACNNSGSRNATESDTPTSPLQSTVFDKLSGAWQSDDGKNFERWTKNDNGTYQYAGFSIKGNDTSWNEQANIYRENNNWVFENTVKEQNNGKSVKFISSILNENNFQFSNPSHDFPTDISYTKVDANTLHAFIAGPGKKGGKDTIHFNFTRVN